MKLNSLFKAQTASPIAVVFRDFIATKNFLFFVALFSFFIFRFSFFGIGCVETASKNVPQNNFPAIKLSTNFEKRIAGLSLVAPPKPFSEKTFLEIKQVKADWIAVIPYAFTKPGEASVHFNASSNWKWWGESLEGVRTTIDSAHKNNIHVMLKPQVFVPGSWVGAIDFNSEQEWQAWEKDYENYIMAFTTVAAERNAEMICIGTEFSKSVEKRTFFWKKLIADIRQKYSGKLVYASNWNDYNTIGFWDDLDFVGIDAYFPLSEDITPSVSVLENAWKPYMDSLRVFQKRVNKKIIFTEYGYLSVDGCAGKGWEIEKRVRSTPINEQAQANAIETLWKVCGKETWWHGGFLWKWFPEGMGHEGYKERDYTPQGKLAEKILTSCHK